MLAVRVEVGSLLAKLAVEFTLIRAGHPLSVVLMHRLVTNLTGRCLFAVVTGSGVVMVRGLVSMVSSVIEMP